MCVLRSIPASTQLANSSYVEAEIGIHLNKIWCSIQTDAIRLNAFNNIDNTYSMKSVIQYLANVKMKVCICCKSYKSAFICKNTSDNANAEFLVSKRITSIWDERFTIFIAEVQEYMVRRALQRYFPVKSKIIASHKLTLS